MGRKSSTQWDFGELFPTAETRQVFSVTDLTLRLKRLIEKEFATVFVSGEISNWRLQSSGHAYFVLKDANAQLNCVLFRGEAGVDRAFLRDGARVTLGGELTVYEPRGTYQLRVTSAEVQGVGALQAAFERLKAKLNAEGLFDPARKRPIPAFPRRIGLVTSPTGAAIQDVLHVIGRRFAGLKIVLVPVRVQGKGAEVEIAAAIALLNRWSGAGEKGGGGEREIGTADPLAHSLTGSLSVPRLDAILVTRGGGSLEDLWCFNEEVVARAIAASAVPVISAVGHEIDFTIADFVADFRAATPSAAAEILTQGYVNSAGFVGAAGQRMCQLARQRLEWSRDEWRGLGRRFLRGHPRRRLESHSQRVDDLTGTILRLARGAIRAEQARLTVCSRRIASFKPAAAIQRRRAAVEDLRRRLLAAMKNGLIAPRARVVQLSGALRLLSPLNVLERGYSITLDAATGAVVRSAQDVSVGLRLRTRLAQGEIESVVLPAKREVPPTS
ncbi:MAG TPA: exodeoxyribonuclease VII large subunit [Candidatus Limnocylindria bacterium]|jgi:exodeoxyribonuclease VII large subunit|nr:exodeoxyribonuclease VII large subunit [Candidatus Limnocylindria bacterium]